MDFEKLTATATTDDQNTATEPAHICDDCGCIITGDVWHFDDGRIMCEDCAADWRQCDDCGEWIKADEGYTTAAGDFICGECFENYYICEDCGEIFAADEITMITSGCGHFYVCENCCDDYYYCEDCGEWFTGEDMRYIEGYGHICDYCYDRGDYCYCEVCERYYHYDDYNYDAEMCNDCAEENCTGVVGYHDGGTGEKYGDYDGEFCGVGFELEIDCDRRDYERERATVDELRDEYGDRLYFERDGSLNGGFEIICEPHTFDEFNRVEWSKMLDICKKHGYTSHDAKTCGLHFHISRAAFGRDEGEQKKNITKLVYFFERYYDEIVKLSRRGVNQLQWCKSYNLPVNNRIKFFEAVKPSVESRYHENRYHAVNLTNYATIEIRIFRGTLNPATFDAAAAFVMAVAQNASRIKWADINNISRWIAGADYELIRAECIKRGAFVEQLSDTRQERRKPHNRGRAYGNKHF